MRLWASCFGDIYHSLKILNFVMYLQKLICPKQIIYKHAVSGVGCLRKVTYFQFTKILVIDQLQKNHSCIIFRWNSVLICYINRSKTGRIRYIGGPFLIVLNVFVVIIYFLFF